MQSRCRTWSHNGSSRIRAKQKLHRKHRSLQKFLESERKPNVIYTDRFFKFGKACQDLSWNHYTSPPHRSETNGIAERAVRRVKEGTSAVLWQVRTKIGGQIPRNVAPVCETAQISYLMGRRIMKDVLVNLWKDRLFHFLTGWVLPKNCEGPVTNPSILKESLTWIVPRIRNVREENLDGWRVGCRPWEVGDDGRIGNLLEKTQCERGDISQTRRIIFPIADGRIKPFGGDQDLRTSTSTRQPPIQGESHVDFLGKSEGSLPPPHDSFPDASEAINDSWSMSGKFRNRLHVEPRVKIHSPREELFPIPMKYIDVSWSTHANLDVNQEKPIDDYWNIDGSRDLSDPWTGFTQFTNWKKNLQKDICCLGEDWRENSRHSGQIIYGQDSGRKCERMPSWRRSKNGHTKSSTSITHDNCVGSVWIDPEDKEFQKTMNNPRKKLETPIARALPSKKMMNNKNCGSGAPNKVKSKLACFL